MHYSDYLELDKILSSQTLVSAKDGEAVHDEMLFIIAHQTVELWFKQIINELDSVLDAKPQDNIDAPQLFIIVSRMTRIKRIMKILIQQIDVLETMTPMDFLEFRDKLIPASGFESEQFRLLETKLGLPQLDKNNSDKKGKDIQPNLFQLIEAWLERTPFLKRDNYSFWDSYREAVHQMLAADKKRGLHQTQITQTSQHFEALFDEKNYLKLKENGEYRFSYRAIIAALFIFLYRDEAALHMPYQLLSTLIDIDEAFSSWRYRHLLMVQRMIGHKIGTGGSTGARYLENTLSKKVFSDLNMLSTYLIPRHVLPPLPKAYLQDSE